MPVFNDLTGQQFTRLKVISFNGYVWQGKLRATWLCKCSCGTEKVITADKLISQCTKSCGCLHREASAIRMTEMHKAGLNVDPEAARKDVLRDYVNSARLRNLSFTLTPEQFYELISQDCHYCGVAPSNKRTSLGGSECIWNGVDRMNPVIGYDSDNCVPACSTCNDMKGSLTYKQFIEVTKRIVNYQRLSVDDALNLLYYLNHQGE